MSAFNPLNLDLESPHKPSKLEHTVFTLLATYLPETSSITANQAAEQVDDLVPSHHQSSEEEKYVQTTGDFLFEFWELMFRIAVQLDYQREPMQRFIALVKALRTFPETKLIQHGGIYDGEPVWRSGFYFGPMLHERWDQTPAYETPRNPYALRWRNMNGLLAHLTNQNLSTYDFHALACISHALETFRRKKPKTPINHRVPAASIWFALCPSMIYLACQRHECADRELSGELWKGEPQQGYSIARWNFWRKRFKELECHSDATEETKEACRSAIEVMDRYPDGSE